MPFGKNRDVRLYVSKPYVDKNKVEMVRVLGTKESFKKADIDLSDFKIEQQSPNSRGVVKIIIRAPADEMVEIIEAAEEFNASLVPKEPETMREWLDDNKDAADLICEGLVDWPPNKEVTIKVIRDKTGLTQRDSRLAGHLMFRDGWIDENRLLTRLGTEEAQSWNDLREMVSE